MGAAFSRVIDNMKTKSEPKSEPNSEPISEPISEPNIKPLNDDNITQFVFVIEEDILEAPSEEHGILLEPTIVPELEPTIEPTIVPELEPTIEPKIVPMDVKDLMKEIIAEALIAEGLAEEVEVDEILPIVSDRKLRKRRKKSL